MKSRIVGLLAIGLLSGPMAASAGVIFSDNFDNDSATSVLDFGSLINWTVSGGTIDYIRSGGYGISCVGGTGGCLDMDGTTGTAGRITSRQLFTFDPGVEYFLDLTLSGNQRGGNSDSVIFGLVSESDGSLIDATLGPFAPGAPFGVFTGVFLGQNAPGQWRLFVEGVGIEFDDQGAILDNYVLRDNRTAVPEPGTLALLGLGLAGLGLSRRRKAA